MKCSFPEYIKKASSSALRPCGQCLNCLTNERRVWTARIMLEASCWASNNFLTLTFRDSCLPSRGVSVEEHQTFIKDLRDHWHRASGRTFRYYGVGEYGDKTARPHYHYALFNYPTCVGSGPTWHGKVFVPCQCSTCLFLSKVWGKGHVFVGNLEVESAGYIAGYVTKKLTKKDDHRVSLVSFDPDSGSYVRLNKEFSKKSTRPGIGFSCVDGIVQRWRDSGLLSAPSAYRIGTKYFPLGRYLKGKINEILQEPPKSLAEIEISQLRTLSSRIEENPGLFSRALTSNLPVALQLVNSQRSLITEQRSNRSSYGTF